MPSQNCRVVPERSRAERKRDPALIRSLSQDAGLAIDQIARSLRAADEARGDCVIAAIDALHDIDADNLSTEELQRAKRTVARLVRLRGWDTKPGDVSLRSTAAALAVALRAMPQPEGATEGGTPCAPAAGTVEPESLVFYAEAMEAIVAHEVPDDWNPEGDREVALRYGVLGTVLFEPFIIALRRMAHVARTRSLAKARRR